MSPPFGHRPETGARKPECLGRTTAACGALALRRAGYLVTAVPLLAFLVLSTLVTASTSPAAAIVNGETQSSEEFRAVVYIESVLGQKRIGCTGTFVHPRLILTAAHCVDYRFSDGPVEGITAYDGTRARTGTQYEVEHVFFAKKSDLGQSRTPDVAILRTNSASPFDGSILPILDAQHRPRLVRQPPCAPTTPICPRPPDYCRRFEYTWPTVVGFSDNARTEASERRSGRAFAECDLDRDETVFVLDGHGRGRPGVRTCGGDSGGPTLWQTGTGSYAVGGVTSRTDDYSFVTDTRCPSSRGESQQAFIPEKFLDRVAVESGVCQSDEWEGCRGIPVPHNGYQLEFRGTRIEQCGRGTLRVRGLVDAYVERGGTVALEVPHRKVRWYCGSSPELTTLPGKARYVVVRRGLTDRQIIIDSYRILSRPETSARVRNIDGQCVDVEAGGITTKGNPINIWPCHSGTAQGWAQIGQAIVNDGGMCLDAKGGHVSTPGTRVQLWPCNGTIAQRWRVVGNAIVTEGGLCLDVQWGKTTVRRTPLWLWSCNELPAQQWSMDGR